MTKIYGVIFSKQHEGLNYDENALLTIIHQLRLYYWFRTIYTVHSYPRVEALNSLKGGK